MTPSRSSRTTHEHVRLHPRVGAVAVALLAIALTACADDGNDVATETAGGTAGTASTAEVTTSGTDAADATTSASTTTTTTAGVASTATSVAPESTAPIPQGPLCEAAGVEGTAGQALGDVTAAEAIADIDSLSTFAALVSQSDTATSRLEGQRPITVFAPVDAAFETAGIDVDALPADQVDGVVLQHIVAGVHTAETLGVTESLQNLAGAPLAFTTENDTVVINESATVGCADLRVSNGVIHLVDAVLQPPSPEATTPTTAGG
jgi:uncharacterized surface protein with fasciclin (FAS1) repeats